MRGCAAGPTPNSSALSRTPAGDPSACYTGTCQTDTSTRAAAASPATDGNAIQRREPGGPCY